MIPDVASLTLGQLAEVPEPEVDEAVRKVLAAMTPDLLCNADASSQVGCSGGGPARPVKDVPTGEAL